MHGSEGGEDIVLPDPYLPDNIDAGTISDWRFSKMAEDCKVIFSVIVLMALSFINS